MPEDKQKLIDPHTLGLMAQGEVREEDLQRCECCKVWFEREFMHSMDSGEYCPECYESIYK